MKKIIVSSFVILLLIQCKAPNNNSTPIEFIINQFDVPNNQMEIKFRITNPTQEVWEGGQWSLHWNQFIGSINKERYRVVYNMYYNNYQGLTKRFKQIEHSKKCKLSTPKEGVGVVFLELGIDKKDITQILELTKNQENNMVACWQTQIALLATGNNAIPVEVPNNFQRQKDYTVTLRRINVGNVANFNTKQKQQIANKTWKESGVLKLVDLKTVLLNKIHNEKGNISNISLNALKQNEGVRGKKVKSTLDFYIGAGKKYKTYDDLLDNLLVLKKINLEALYKDFVPSTEFWAFTYAGEKETNSQNKMKNVPVKVHPSRNKDIKLKKNAPDKVYKTFQNAAQLNICFRNKDYIIRLFANGKASVTIGDEEATDIKFAIELMAKVRELINSHSRAISQSERSLYYKKPCPLKKNEFEDKISNAMINAKVKTNNKYVTTAQNIKGAVNLFNILKKYYEKEMVEKTHIGIKGSQAPLAISQNKAKVIFKFKGDNVEYSTGNNGEVLVLRDVVTIQFNMAINGTIEITGKSIKSIDMANVFINKLFTTHKNKLLVKVANNTSPNRVTKPIVSQKSTAKSSVFKTPNVSNKKNLFLVPNTNNNSNVDNFLLQNFNVIEVAGDGHCLFRAIAVCLNHIHTKGALRMGKEHELNIAKKLRKIAASIICKNKGNNVVPGGSLRTYKMWIVDDLPDGFQEKHGFNDTTNEDIIFKKYCKELKDGTLWGGQTEIKVLSDYLNVPIIVYDGIQNNTNGTLIGENYLNKERIHLRRKDGNHYDALIRKQQSTRNSHSNNNNYNNYNNYNE